MDFDWTDNSSEEERKFWEETYRNIFEMGGSQVELQLTFFRNLLGQMFYEDREMITLKFFSDLHALNADNLEIYQRLLAETHGEITGVKEGGLIQTDKGVFPAPLFRQQKNINIGDIDHADFSSLHGYLLPLGDMSTERDRTFRFVGTKFHHAHTNYYYPDAFPKSKTLSFTHCELLGTKPRFLRSNLPFQPLNTLKDLRRDPTLKKQTGVVRWWTLAGFNAHGSEPYEKVTIYSNKAAPALFFLDRFGDCAKHIELDVTEKVMRELLPYLQLIRNLTVHIHR
jgi:hypothetical protein